MVLTAKQSIKQMITDIGHTRGLVIQDNTELLLSGVLDSLDVIRIASDIEKTLNVEVSPLDITIENFESINAIYDYIVMRVESP